MTKLRPELPHRSYDRLDDRSLLALSSEHNRRAFDALMSRYERLIRKVVSRRVPHTEVDDLVQEVLVRVWANAQRLRDVYSVPGWLATLTVNICLDHRRRESRRVPEVSFDLLIDVLDDGRRFDPQDQALLIDYILDFLQTLPRLASQIVMQRTLQDDSFRKIAIEHRVPESTVKTLYYRSIDKIAAYLHAEGVA